MQRALAYVFLLTVIFVAGFAALVSAQQGQAFLVGGGSVIGSIADYYHSLIGLITGDWQQYGQLFTTLQGQWFWKGFLLIIVAIPAIFLLHYLIIGAQHFDHSGEKVLFFPLFTRVVHFFAAVSFTLLALTGLLMVFGGYFGGGAPIRLARDIHLISAMVFVLPALLMLFMWLKDMLPQAHDLSWMLILGGYLNKNKEPVPAGKFNAGQKMYFWFATVGGCIMAYSGYVIWEMSVALDTVRIFAIVHNILGGLILAFYLTHVYMSVFAIAGSLESMKTGYKSKEEVDILHSRYDH